MRKLTTKEFVQRAIALQGTKYNYDKVDYQNMHTDVEIVCPIHGSFFQTPSNHLKGYGCHICNKIDARKLPLNVFIERSRKKHCNKYDYSRVVYKNSKTKVEIICPIHGVFMQTPEKHMVGKGCPKCAKNHADTRESFIRKAQTVHGDLYDYSKVEYINSSTKVCIVDAKYGEFWQTPNAHLNGRGHPLRKPEKCYFTKKANHSFGISIQEKIAKDMLYKKFGEENVYCEYVSDLYPFSCDFYIHPYDLYIELNIYVTHGGHWFDENNPDDLTRLKILKKRASPRNLYEKMIQVWTKTDLKKRSVAIDNHLNYLVFWKEDMSDFIEWYESFDEKHILKQF